jgi:hypothetical protein
MIMSLIIALVLMWGMMGILFSPELIGLALEVIHE